MTDEQNKAAIAAALASGDPLALLKIKSRMDDEQIAELKAELARRSSSSPSVPTATQEQRTTDYRDFETFGDLPESVRVAVRAHTFAQPAGGELWDNMTSREQRNWMVQLYDKANRGASSEEAASSDTKRQTLSKIEAAWRKMPDLRLCQLIVNALPAAYGNDPYYIEDSQLADFVFDFANRVREPR